MSVLDDLCPPGTHCCCCGIGDQCCDCGHIVEKTPMNRTSIETRIHQTIIDHLGVEAEKVTDEAKFEEDLRADSLDMVELVMALEEDFDIRVDDDEAQKVLTVKDAYDLVERLAA